MQKTQKRGRKKTGKGLQKDRQGGAKTYAKWNTGVKDRQRGCKKTGKGVYKDRKGVVNDGKVTQKDLTVM